MTLLATFWSGRRVAHNPLPDSVAYTTGMLLTVSVLVFAYSVDTVPYVPLSMKEEKDN